MERVIGLLRPMMAYVPNVVIAIVVFVIGWIVCKTVAKGVSILLKKVKIDEHLNKKNLKNPIQIEPILSKLVYYILLIYVILLTLNLLGIDEVLDPLEGMFAKFALMVPNVIAATFISFLGYVLAKTVSSIVLAAAAGLDPLTSKAGLGKSTSISKILGQLVFIVIFIPVVISSLHVLRIEAISVPAIALLENLSNAIPHIIGAAVVLAVAYVVGRFVATFLADLLKNIGTDDIPEKIGASGIFGKKSFSKFCSGLVFFFIMLGASISAVGYLRMPEISNILSGLLHLSGNIVLGLLILGLGNFIATAAYNTLSKSTKGGLFPIVVRVAILALVLAMGLHTMGVADNIVDMAFAIIMGTAALTIVLSFGLGGREAAGKQMEHWLSQLRDNKKK